MKWMCDSIEKGTKTLNWVNLLRRLFLGRETYRCLCLCEADLIAFFFRINTNKNK